VKVPYYDLQKIQADGSDFKVIANVEENNETFVGVTSWCSVIYNELRFEDSGEGHPVSMTKAFSWSLTDLGDPILLDDLGPSSFDLVYSSNGKTLYYNRGGEDAFAVGEDGSNKVALAASGDVETLVDLALKDGRAVIKSSAGGGAPSFVSAALDGSSTESVAPELPGAKAYFGRAGHSLVMTHTLEGSSNADIVAIPVKGGAAVTLAEDEDLEIPAHNLPGGEVIYTRFRGTFGNDLFIVPADGSAKPEPLVEESGDDRFAAYLP
jgi:hypothetical protein